MNKSDSIYPYIVAIALVVFGVVMRLSEHPYNFTPILAISLFTGICFYNRKYLLTVPLLMMFISDYFLGFHSLILWVYAPLLICLLIGIAARQYLSGYTVLYSSVLCSVIFFLVSNFGVWIIGYPKTFEGFISCYIMALPFFKNTLIGTVMYSYVFLYAYSFLTTRTLVLKKVVNQ